MEALFPAEVEFVRADEAMAEEPLHPDEAARTTRMVAKRLREFTAGRACARRALASLGVRDFALLPGEDRAPIWPAGVVGSITHSNGYCAAVAARTGAVVGLGLDAEAAEALSPELVARICTPADRSHCASLPVLADADWHKLVFSAKESLYKCYYPLTRHFLGFQDAEIRLDPSEQSFVATLTRSDAPSARGTRTFRGRFQIDREHVLTAVTLTAAECSGE